MNKLHVSCFFNMFSNAISLSNVVEIWAFQHSQETFLSNISNMGFFRTIYTSLQKLIVVHLTEYIFKRLFDHS